MAAELSGWERTVRARGESVGVARRLLPALAVLLAAAADAWGGRELALLCLLAAVPAAGAAALAFFGELVDSLETPKIEFVRLAQALLWAAALALIVLSAALRAPAGVGEVPRQSATALALCLGLVALEGLLAAALEFRGRLEPRPALGLDDA